MMKSGETFRDLTKAEVEALLECFDFLRNGYKPLFDFRNSLTWVIKLKHAFNASVITVCLFDSSYTIIKNGVVRKTMEFIDHESRYSLVVNSDLSCGVIRQSGGGGERLIYG